ncbi:MAG: 30S ribosomal protein S14 [Pseudomonadota bacterium]
MAKVGMIERQKKRERLVMKYEKKRAELKEKLSRGNELELKERVQLSMKLAKLPRNSSKVRLNNRCEVSGRPKAYYRKLRMSRIALRDLASRGEIPGMVKSSW